MYDAEIKADRRRGWEWGNRLGGIAIVVGPLAGSVVISFWLAA